MFVIGHVFQSKTPSLVIPWMSLNVKSQTWIKRDHCILWHTSTCNNYSSSSTLQNTCTSFSSKAHSLLHHSQVPKGSLRTTILDPFDHPYIQRFECGGTEHIFRRVFETSGMTVWGDIFIECFKECDELIEGHIVRDDFVNIASTYIAYTSKK